MSAVAPITAPRAHDLIGVDINVGDRVWLVRETRAGFDRICAGTVTDFVDDKVCWIADPMSEEEWAHLTEGCCLRTNGAYAPPSRHNSELHFSKPSSLKVVARTNGARR